MNGSDIREALCNCGALRVRCSGEPVMLSICHCDGCRRRTASAFGIAAFYHSDCVEIFGSSTLFEKKTGEDGRIVRYHFCPACGSTLYWEASWRPSQIGVGAGAFCGEIPEPAQSVDDHARYNWIHLSESVRRR